MSDVFTIYIKHISISCTASIKLTTQRKQPGITENIFLFILAYIMEWVLFVNYFLITV